MIYVLNLYLFHKYKSDVLKKLSVNLFSFRRFAAWVGDGVNWCSPYKGWQKIYDNSPLQIVQKQGYGNKKHLILGKAIIQTLS